MKINISSNRVNTDQKPMKQIIVKRELTFVIVYFQSFNIYFSLFPINASNLKII
jgi:hypothetical protein